MAKVSREKFVDAIKTDWEMDFVINNNDEFHFEKAYDFNKKVYVVDLWDWRNKNDPKCILKREYGGKFEHLEEVLNVMIPSYNKKINDLVDLIEIEFESLSTDSAPWIMNIGDDGVSYPNRPFYTKLMWMMKNENCVTWGDTIF